MKNNLILSLTLHVSIILVVIILGISNSNQRRKNNSNEGYKTFTVEIISKSDQGNSDGIGEYIHPFKTHLDSRGECNSFYGGIGIGIDMSTGRVTEVYKGYPAYVSGIKVNDIINRGELITGKPGTKVLVTIKRNNTTIELNIVRDKICYSSP